MKLAISLPDDLARRIDQCAKRMRVARSQLIAEGARLVLAKHHAVDATAEWNAVIDATGQPGDEAELAVLRRKSKRAVRGSTGRW